MSRARGKPQAETDLRFMREALALAETARGSTRPNPAVGAVIVKDGRVRARGHTQPPGQAHAEVHALAQVGFRAPGATLYVTLEPCCHQGRTGPCTTPIIEAGITRVVVGCRDSNPKVSGRGITRLRRAGITVDVGVLEAESQRINRGFLRWIRDGRPFITLKAAATLDGFIASARPPRTRAPAFITNGASRALAHELRALHDAILVGSGTVLVDDPRLTVRRSDGPTPAIERIVLDGRLRTPARARLLREPGGPVVIVTRAFDEWPRAERAAVDRRARALQNAGATLLPLPAGRDGRVPLDAVLRALAARDIQSLLVEGGSEVLGAFIAARLADEVAFFFAPRLDGTGVPIASGAGLPFHAPLRLGPLTARSVDGDILLTASVVAEH